jgi:hypothetical protein
VATSENDRLHINSLSDTYVGRHLRGARKLTFELIYFGEVARIEVAHWNSPVLEPITL